MKEIIEVIKEVQRAPKAFQSDYARKYAVSIAEAASRGLITCLQNGINQRHWMATPKGLLLASEGNYIHG